MQSLKAVETNVGGESPAVSKQPAASQPDFSGEAMPIADFVTREDFPQCTLGVFVNIGGVTGVVVDIVRQSLKLKTPEGLSQSFNGNILRKLYGPAPKVEPIPAVSGRERPAAGGQRVYAPMKTEEEEPAAEAPKRNVITEPDFSQPLTPIAELVKRIDFPQCAFGLHVDVGGITGVVVEIVKQSLKIKGGDGLTRSYNAVGLRKIHG